MPNFKHISDESLMCSIQEGKEEAFNELYERYSNRILYFMYRMLRQDEGKAQDLLQDVFLKIVEHPEKFDVSRNFKTWIFTVAANICKNYFRSQKGRLVDLDELPLLAERETDVYKEINPNEFKEKLNQCLNDLPYQYREAFILKHKEGLSLKEIALVMNCPLGTVKSRLNSANRLLSKKLSPYRNQLLANKQ